MDTKIWKINDSLQCQQLTTEYVEEAQNVADEAFFRHENVCQVLGVSNDNEALLELKELTLATIQDGFSIIAVDTSKNAVVGFAFNKLQVKNGPSFEQVAKSWKNPKSLAVVDFMTDIDNICNVFDHCQVDCLLELMFVGTLPEYRGKGIASKLVEATLELATNVKNGIEQRKSIGDSRLKLEHVPQIATAMFTSTYTQKIGKKFEFQVLAEKSYDEFEWEGKRFSDIIKGNPPTVTLEYKIL